MRARTSRNSSRVWVVLGLLASSAAPGLAARAAERPNIILVQTDDQRFDTVEHMPLTLAALAARGVTFSNAFVTTPSCAPARASLLAGGFASHATGVVDNQLPNGGATVFHDATTIATALQAAGYTTGLIGKYLNGYELIAPRVPPGWSDWRASIGNPVVPTQYVVGSSGGEATTGIATPTINEHGSDYIRDRALDFVDAHAAGPFFLYLAFGAPHEPATPAPQDEGLFPDYLYRGRGYGEDVSDKSLRVQIAAGEFPGKAAAADELHRNQLRTLQAVDRAIDAIVARLQQRAILDDTVIVFTSDNGYLWGEHGLIEKADAYEESIRVPLIVVLPGVPARSEDGLVAGNLDLAETFLDLAGVPSLGGDGVSLVPLLQDPQHPGRDEIHFEQAQQWRVWAALRTEQWKYVEDISGERELYDLLADPFELTNRASDPAYQTVLADLAARLVPELGLAILPRWPLPSLGVAYQHQLRSWGGVPPLVWSLEAGRLPAGLHFDPETATIAGVPEEGPQCSFEIGVSDAATDTQTGQPHRYVQTIAYPGAVPCSEPWAGSAAVAAIVLGVRHRYLSKAKRPA